MGPALLVVIGMPMSCCMPRSGTLACAVWLGLLLQLWIASAMPAMAAEIKSTASTTSSACLCTCLCARCACDVHAGALERVGVPVRRHVSMFAVRLRGRPENEFCCCRVVMNGLAWISGPSQRSGRQSRLSGFCSIGQCSGTVLHVAFGSQNCGC